jgi:hypothetical protein
LNNSPANENHTAGGCGILDPVAMPATVWQCLHQHMGF